MKAFLATWLAMQCSGWSNPLAWALVIIALARVIAEPAINLSGLGTTYGAHELFQDGGVNHYLAWQLKSGKTLYEDIAYPYGPLPAWLYAGCRALQRYAISQDGKDAFHEIGSATKPSWCLQSVA